MIIFYISLTAKTSKYYLVIKKQTGGQSANRPPIRRENMKNHEEQNTTITKRGLFANPHGCYRGGDILRIYAVNFAVHAMFARKQLYCLHLLLYSFFLKEP